MRPFTKLLLFLTLPLYLLDQLSKWWIVLNFAPPWSPEARSIDLIPNYFSIIRVHNQGVAFGLGNGSDWAPIVFLFVPLIGLGVLSYLAKKTSYFHEKLAKIALALLVAGIFGNLTDRLTQGFYLHELRQESFLHRLASGYVVDFIDCTIPIIHYRWPAFNVADSCVCVAATLLFLSGIREDRKKAQLAKSKD